ncbi:type I-U CRISPR-associated protein Csb2 [Embleya sp. NPDC050493]|uniref:type I-G CRISPR-associated protein Csb2 n=1 Tax=Embleya sp. NPDC050493 TaxID=3363989 RepID=UPI0037AC401C
MITIALEFPWRRYHATPWGRHVNEGAVELPPAPWRILRALYATWHERLPDLPEKHVHAVLTALAQPPRRYLLPPHQLQHTRHYLPDSHHKSGTNGNTDKAVDAFALLGGDATIHIQWHGDLDSDQTDTLRALLEAMPYFGRADSLVDARLADTLPRGDDLIPATELADGQPPPGWTTVDLLAPELPLDIEALTARPVDVRAGKLLYPPGSRHLTYATPTPTDTTAPPRQRHRPTTADATGVTAIRLSIRGRVQPPLTQALPLADAFRAACIRILQPPGSPRRDSALAGKNADGTPYTAGQHRHAHFIPHDSDGDRRIDQLLVWIPDGLTDAELDAIHRLATGDNRVYYHKSPRDLFVRVAAQGPADRVLPVELTRPATVWESVTPFTAPRHPHRGQDRDAHLLAEVTRELRYRGLPAPTAIRRIPGDWPLHIRHRTSKNETRDHTRPCDGLRVELSTPVAGPLLLGRHSHYGLGLFHPRN